MVDAIIAQAGKLDGNAWGTFALGTSASATATQLSIEAVIRAGSLPGQDHTGCRVHPRGVYGRLDQRPA
jgi:hypothetical protein